MISVVIPAHNAAATIPATLRSLVEDKGLIAEILLVNDRSEDDTSVVAEAAARSNGLPLRVLEASCGNAGAARNVALPQVRGGYVFYLDADDEVIPGGLRLLRDALKRHPDAGLSVGASVHRGRHANKLKTPGAFSADPLDNARRYLANDIRSITVGSGLVSTSKAGAIRFPESIGLDEDTCYWAAVLTKVAVTTIDDPVLVYNLDDMRMSDRFVTSPRKVLLGISLELNRLAALGVDKATLQKRKAWIALRIARQLLRRERYREAFKMMRVAMAHPAFRFSPKALDYWVRIKLGLHRAKRHADS
jgi:glycosyltransferase involved in cell wall biosynthesis